MLWQRKLVTFCIILIVFAGNYIAAVFFNGVNAIYRNEGIWRENIYELFNLNFMAFAPAGAIAVIGIAFLIEAKALGWESCSIRRVFEDNSTSIRVDLFYTILFASNLAVILGYLFTLGVAYHISTQLRSIFDVSLLAGANPLWAFLILLTFNSFIFYWFHRFTHTGFLWELHKSHHSAEQLVIITNFRNHPLDIGLRSIFYTIPSALLGVSPTITIACTIFSGFLVLMQHSDMDWNMPIIEKYFFIGAKGHRIHHSRKLDHQNKNFGYIIFWDWIFGTLHVADDDVVLGIEAKDDLKQIHKTKFGIKLLWLTYSESIKAFCSHLLTSLRLVKSNT